MVKFCFHLLVLGFDHFKDLRLTSINDRNDRGAEVFAAGCAKIGIVTIEWENIAARKHCVVFNERAMSWSNVRSEDNKLGLTSAKRFKSLSNSKGVFARFGDERKGADDRFTSAALLLAGH